LSPTYHLEADAPRLDRFLVSQNPEINRSRWEAWIRNGNVTVDGHPVTKPGTALRAGATVVTELPPPNVPARHLEPEALELPTLYEDDRLWIIDKPADLVVHPGPGHPNGTVLNALLGRLRDRTWEGPNEGDPENDEETLGSTYPGLVHRLDRYTTGCLIMAKDAEAQAHLQAQFKARTVEKRYLALCRLSRKLPELGSLLVDAPLARHRVERLKMTVNASGRPSQTRIKVLAKAHGLALVDCELLTGRTHQIRVHLSHLGAPLLGDPLYGGTTRWQDLERRAFEVPHPLLHAWRLAVDHPTDGRRIRVTAPLPEAFCAVLRRLDLTPPSPEP